MSEHDHRSLCRECNSYRAGEHQKKCRWYRDTGAGRQDRLAALEAFIKAFDAWQRARYPRDVNAAWCALLAARAALDTTKLDDAEGQGRR